MLWAHTSCSGSAAVWRRLWSGVLTLLIVAMGAGVQYGLAVAAEEERKKRWGWASGGAGWVGGGGDSCLQQNQCTFLAGAGAPGTGPAEGPTGQALNVHLACAQCTKVSLLTRPNRPILPRPPPKHPHTHAQPICPAHWLPG